MEQAEREHAELLILYQEATQDIRTFQERQTSVTNLTLLAYAGLIALSGNTTIRAQVPLMAVSAVAAFAALAWLVLLQKSIQFARQRSIA
jgi:hypothetical protein